MYRNSAVTVKFVFAMLTTLLIWLPQAPAADEVEPAPQEVAVDVQAVDRMQRGLHSTIGGYLSLQPVTICHERHMSLCVEGLLKPVPVLAVIQPHHAPLVVVLPGIGGRTDDDFSRVWPGWLAAAGFHVLTFNSTFRPEFVAISGTGPSGNVWSECEKITAIIDTFLRRPEMEGKFSKLGVIGMSYGGTQALILGALQCEGRLPFKLDAIRAFSPPLKMERTAALLDQWFNEDRWRYTLIELAAMFAPGKFCCHTFSNCSMRAAIAVSFQYEFYKVVIENNDYFCMNLVPRAEDEEYRRDLARQWGFERYSYDMALPWWRDQRNIDVTKLIEDTHVCELLKRQPPETRIIIAEDDPFNTAADMRELHDCDSGQVEFLETGGHVGYIQDAAIRARITGLFDEAR